MKSKYYCCIRALITFHILIQNKYWTQIVVEKQHWVNYMCNKQNIDEWKTTNPSHFHIGSGYNWKFECWSNLPKLGTCEKVSKDKCLICSSLCHINLMPDQTKYTAKESLKYASVQYMIITCQSEGRSWKDIKMEHILL